MVKDHKYFIWDGVINFFIYIALIIFVYIFKIGFKRYDIFTLIAIIAIIMASAITIEQLFRSLSLWYDIKHDKISSKIGHYEGVGYKKYDIFFRNGYAILQFREEMKKRYYYLSDEPIDVFTKNEVRYTYYTHAKVIKSIDILDK